MQSPPHNAVSLERKFATGGTTAKLFVQLLISVPGTLVYTGVVNSDVFPAESRCVAVIHPSKEPLMLQLPLPAAVTAPIKSAPCSEGSPGQREGLVSWLFKSSMIAPGNDVPEIVAAPAAL